jgi:23S rRNA (adenine2503-C2)-methyltransferase
VDAIHPLARTPEEWRDALAARGEPAYRALQIFRWLHARGLTDARAMTDLPIALREALAAEGLAAPSAAEHVHRSADRTRKLLVRLRDGAAVETVLLPVGPLDDDADIAAANDEEEPSAARGEGAQTRVTQCVSTQVGCAMACVFCASGVAGLKRHLGAEEIVGQVLAGRAALEHGEALRNVVFMGMGEPLHNYDAVARAIVLMTHPEGMGLARRRITVSTAGLAPEILRLGRDFDGQVGLAVSLHHPVDARRSALVPINKRHPLAELVAAMRAYPLPRGRRITVEYVLIAGENDGDEEARLLATLLAGLRVKLNLIPMNPIAGSPLGPPSGDRVAAFQRIVCDAGHICFVRRRRGDDVAAACGQLALRGAPPRPALGRRRPCV